MSDDVMDRWNPRPGETGALAAMRDAAAPAGLGSHRAYDPYEQPRLGLLHAIGTVEELALLLRSAAASISPHAVVQGGGGDLNTRISRALEAVGQEPLTPMTEAATPLMSRHPSDDELRAEWRAAGGQIHGPIVESVAMSERQYFSFRRGLGLAPGAAPVWSREDETAATAEGWDVLTNSERRLEIERIDAPENTAGESLPAVFASDDQAIGHVYGKAQEGSALHQKALLLTLVRMKDFVWPAAPAPEPDARSIDNEGVQYDGESERVEAVFLQQQRDRVDQFVNDMPDAEPEEGAMRP